MIKRSKHDSDCQIFRSGICTCGYLHMLLPQPEKWASDEKVADEMARHEILNEILFRINARLIMPKPISPEEQERIIHELEEHWRMLGGRISGTQENS